MPVRYDVYEIPSPENDNEVLLHARVVNNGTITTKQLAQSIEYESSITEGDIYSVLTSLSRHVIEFLSNGSRVHIEGLGYFQLTLASPRVSAEKEIKGNLLTVKAIRFMPERNLKKNVISKTQFIRANKRSICSQKLSDSEIDALLIKYFEKHTFITRASFQVLCGLTKSTASERIKRFVKVGRLKNSGTPRFPVYELCNK